MSALFRLAVQNFWRHRSRYLVLLVIVLVGSGLQLLLLGAATSLGQSLRTKAALYFAGDVAVLGFGPGGTHRIVDDAAVLDSLKTSGVPYQSLTRRTVSYDSESVLFFSNNSLKQRRLIGVDLSIERSALKALDLEEGSIDRLGEGNGILISRVTADKLQVRVGDTCTLLLDTVKGSKNTLSVVVQGIFHDTSFFGFSSYLSIETLNQALDLPEGTSTEMGMILDNGDGDVAAAESLQRGLTQKFAVQIVESKAELDAIPASHNTKPAYAVMTLQSRLSQIQDILDSIVALSLVLNAVLLIIVVLGVGNTIRAVLIERTREIGVYRALGMGRGRLVSLILTEVGVLVGTGGVVGLGAGALALGMLSMIDWGQNSLATMFLQRGHLAWVLPAPRDCVVFLFSIVAGTLGALGPAWKAARWKPVDALRYRA